MMYINFVFYMESLIKKYIQPIADGTMTIPVYLYPEHELYMGVVKCLDYVDKLCEIKRQGCQINSKERKNMIINHNFTILVINMSFHSQTSCILYIFLILYLI